MTPYDAKIAIGHIFSLPGYSQVFESWSENPLDFFARLC